MKMKRNSMNMSINSNSSHLSPSHVHGNMHYFLGPHLEVCRKWSYAIGENMVMEQLSVVPLSAYKPTHNPQFLQLL